jgi:hypothetical protein
LAKIDSQHQRYQLLSHHTRPAKGKHALGVKEQVLLALTLLLSVITLGTGRSSVLQGVVHLLIFAVFLFFAVAP